MTLFLAQAEGEAPVENGAITDRVADSQSLGARAMEGDTAAMGELFASYGLPIVWALVIIVGSLIVGKIIAGMVRNGTTKAKVDETLSRFFASMAYYLVLTLGVIFALSKFGIDVTAFAAILAAAGFAVGMAMSGTLSNFAAGVMLLIFRPFKVGDFIIASGVSGTVTEVELFTTTLDTPDNRRIIVPNGSVFGSTIENVNHHSTRRVDVNVGVEYSAGIDRTREVLEAAIQTVDGRLDDPAPVVYLLDLGDSSVNWVVRIWTNTADFWAVRERATRAVKLALDEAGIGIPFPQMDVHLDK